MGLEAVVAEAAEGAITAAATLEEGITARTKASFRILPATVTIVVDTHMADTVDILKGVDMEVEEAVASAPIVLGRCLFSLVCRHALHGVVSFVVPSLHLHALYVVCNRLY